MEPKNESSEMEIKKNASSSSTFVDPSSYKRRQTDLTNLLMKGYVVELVDDRMDELDVEFHGPPNSLYEGYIWTVTVSLPKDYPASPPRLWFKTEIFHPNICDCVCLDILADNWNPAIELVSIFNLYLPQLLMVPNLDDPFDYEAANFYYMGEEVYEQKVKDHCKTHAKSKLNLNAENKAADSHDNNKFASTSGIAQDDLDSCK